MANQAADHEEGFVRAFVLPERRERYLYLISAPKARKKFDLCHFRDLDLRIATQVPSHQQHPRPLHDLLKQRGAPRTCYVISPKFSNTDRLEMTLMEALDTLVGTQVGFFLSCIPGKLGYFEDEEPGQRYILERADR